MRVCILSSCLAGFILPGMASAVIVTTPDKVVDINNPSEFFFDVGLSGSNAEEVSTWDYYFVVIPDTGATGSISFSGDWAIEHPTAPLFPGFNPLDDVGDEYAAGAFQIPGTATLDDSKFLFRAIFDVTPGTSGTFFIDVLEGDAASGMSGANVTAWQDGSITVVPEPAAFGVFGLVGSVLALRRRRRA